MITRSPYLEAPRRLRAFVRAHETSLVILAAIVGGIVLLVWMACVCIGLVGTVFVFTQSYALYFLGGRYPLLGNIIEPPPFPYPTPPPPLAAKDEGGPPLPMDPSPI